jgi:8-oxo-dGTP pyrophosphatase MutT (NUDIX family)
MRSHPGQVSFPGGAIDDTDASPTAAALREAEEETGLDPAGVVPLALLPELYLPPSGFVVTPVLAHWADPSAVHAVDPGETAAVVRAPLAHLTDTAHRLRVGHPSGFTGPAFSVAGLLVWGFTGGLLSALLDLGGWARPWDTTRVLDLGDAWSAARSGRQEVAGS